MIYDSDPRPSAQLQSAEEQNHFSCGTSAATQRWKAQKALRGACCLHIHIAFCSGNSWKGKCCSRKMLIAIYC